jgi:hypothetical protein
VANPKTGLWLKSPPKPVADYFPRSATLRTATIYPYALVNPSPTEEAPNSFPERNLEINFFIESTLQRIPFF